MHQSKGLYDDLELLIYDDRVLNGEITALTLGTGENVSPEFAAFLTRPWFARALNTFAKPKVLELFSFENLALALSTLLPARTLEDKILLSEAARKWCLDLNLDDPWIHDAAVFSLGYTVAPVATEEDLVVEDVQRHRCRFRPVNYKRVNQWVGKITPEEESKRLSDFRKFGRMVWQPEYDFVNVPIYFDHLKPLRELVYDDNGDPYGEFEDDGWLTSFDPRTEKVKAVTDRVLETLRPRVQAAVEAIAAADREHHGDLPAVEFRSPRPFEWLVRYQVLGETYSGIARSESITPANVRKAVLKAATLAGLTLRSPDRGGRPKKA